MREIKFRGKRKDIGEWVYGYLLVLNVFNYEKVIDEKKYYIQHFAHEDYEEENRFEVIPETVGQYTGLKDINGVEIYEGDIVEYDKGCHVVYWDKYFGWCLSDELLLGEVNFSLIKVLGNKFENEVPVKLDNIYQNPELLEEE